MDDEEETEEEQPLWACECCNYPGHDYELCPECNANCLEMED